MEIQLRVRQQAQELDDFIKDIERWEAGAKVCDAELIAHPKPVPKYKDIRKKTVFSTKSSEEAEQKQSKMTEQKPKEKPKPIPSSDYRAWDRYDADEAAEKVDNEEKEKEKRQEIEEKKKKAEAIRDQGNDLFRKGKYFQAAECYSQAMKLDPTNATFASNRSMCYLKLEKPNQAESDASLSIQLNPTYAKGYYRRAMARKELRKYQLAIDDLNKVLELEPSSKQALDEKTQILKLMEPLTSTTSNVLLNENRNNAPIMTEISTSKKTEPTTTTTTKLLIEETSTTTTTTNIQKPEKETEEEKDKQKPAKPIYAVPSVVVPLKLELPQTPPQTFFEFNTVWASLESSPDLRAKLLQQIPSNKLGDLFKGSVNPSLLGSLIQIISSQILPNDPKIANDILEGLTSIGRFDMLVLCLSSSDKTLLKEMFDGKLKESQSLRLKWKI